MTTQITVLGLGQIGTSIGLALAGHKEEIVRVGNDRDLSVARQAERLGAFDKIVVNLHQAVEKADVVIMALPVGEIEETMQVIAEDLKPGAVVVDTSNVRVPVATLISKLLPPERYLVTVSPSINPAYLDAGGAEAETAHADLFKNSVMVITSPPETHSGAIQLASDLTALLGATPFYADPYEADGLAASSQTLPKLLAAAFVHSTMDQPGWREGRKIAGPLFAQATAMVQAEGSSKKMGQEALFNRENMTRVIDNLIDELSTVRDLVDQQDSEGLHDYLSKAQKSRDDWVRQRINANWEAGGPASPEVPTSGQMLGRLIGLRPKKDKK